MSQQLFISNTVKPFLNGRVNDLIIDGDINVNGTTASFANSITFTESQQDDEPRLNGNEQFSYSFTASGCISGNFNLTFKEIGGVCQILIDIPPTVATATDVLILTPPGTFVLDRFSPEIDTYYNILVRNGNYADGQMEIASDGVISIGLKPTGTSAAPLDLTDTNTIAVSAIQVSYMVAD